MRERLVHKRARRDYDRIAARQQLIAGGIRIVAGLRVALKRPYLRGAAAYPGRQLEGFFRRIPDGYGIL